VSARGEKPPSSDMTPCRRRRLRDEPPPRRSGSQPCRPVQHDSETARSSGVVTLTHLTTASRRPTALPAGTSAVPQPVRCDNTLGFSSMS
jgi:hypothetical protein